MKTAPQFVSAYFDGDLSPSDQAELRVWLLESSLHVKSFVIHSFVHSQLIDFIGPEPTRVNAIVSAEVSPPLVEAPAIAARDKSLRSVVGRMLTLAAALMGVVALTYFYAVRPEVVASVNGTRNVKWAAGADTRNVGSLLHARDELAIDDGSLHIVFARGGQVALQGPARFRIESDQAGRLIEGRLSVLALEHAVGFTIHTARLTAVDLGTEFYLERLPDDSCVLQVFDGLVEIQLTSQQIGNSHEEGLPIPEGRAIRFDAATGKVTSIEYDNTKRLPDTTWSQ
jgi:ferric-dicitrate binding protein FerR (iron transport regulator)